MLMGRWVFACSPRACSKSKASWYASCKAMEEGHKEGKETQQLLGARCVMEGKQHNRTYTQPMTHMVHALYVIWREYKR